MHGRSWWPAGARCEPAWPKIRLMRGGKPRRCLGHGLELKVQVELGEIQLDTGCLSHLRPLHHISSIIYIHPLYYTHNLLLYIYLYHIFTLDARYLTVGGRGVSSAEDDLAESESTTWRWAIPGHERHGRVQVGFLLSKAFKCLKLRSSRCRRMPRSSLRL